MVGRGILKELFLKNMEPDAKKLINKAPYNLENGIKPKVTRYLSNKDVRIYKYKYYDKYKSQKKDKNVG